MFAKVHAALDKTVVKALDKVGHCCKRGCHYCCYEPLITSRSEAQYIVDGLVDGLTPETIEKVKRQTVDWLKRANLRLPEHTALEWRSLNVACPILDKANGECMAYERRPIGCRMFFALKNPDNCQMPQREHQLFVCYSPEFQLDLAVALLQVEETHVMDHLGIHLANILFDLKLESAVATTFQCTDPNETHPK